MTGCFVSWKCLVACFPVEESQQPTWPHDWHSRSDTHFDPSTKHSSQAPGVRSGGKSSAVNRSKCSHEFAIWSSNLNCNFAPMTSCSSHYFCKSLLLEF